MGSLKVEPTTREIPIPTTTAESQSGRGSRNLPENTYQVSIALGNWGCVLPAITDSTGFDGDYACMQTKFDVLHPNSRGPRVRAGETVFSISDRGGDPFGVQYTECASSSNVAIRRTEGHRTEGIRGIFAAVVGFASLSFWVVRGRIGDQQYCLAV